MNWEVVIRIVEVVGGIVVGLGIGKYFFNPRAAIKRPELENESVAITSLKEAMETMSQALTASHEAEVKAREDAEKAREEASEERRLKAEEQAKNTTLQFCMCSHMGCVLRKPTPGTGQQYLEEHKDESGKGFDYTPVNVLLRRIDTVELSEK